MLDLRRTLALLLPLSLMAIGVMLVDRATAVRSWQDYGNYHAYGLRQAQFALLALLAFFLAWRTTVPFWQNWAWSMWAIAVVLNGFLLVPGWSIAAGGAARWLKLGDLVIAPAGLMLLTTCLVLPLLPRRRWMLALLMGESLLLAAQPDFSQIPVLWAAGLTVLVLKGNFGLREGLAGALGLLLFSGLAWLHPYVQGRIYNVLWPIPGQGGEDYLGLRRMWAEAGWWGQGFTWRQESYYISSPEDDYLFAFLAHKLGWVAAVLLVIAYLAWVWAVWPRRWEKYWQGDYPLMVRGALLAWLGSAAALHFLTNSGWFPITTINLPWMSWGGTGLITTAWAAGLAAGMVGKEEGEYAGAG
ncbi:FtsW/RodA/SpoVE family cell cycle protein [Carboxydocella sp. JDF658]|uniref:FtsW/RodA/SpoVE family cell cycle protein n=1 Tax=Carboxydocella sp. JDF658 TaxID=1926600 RepID=UPI0009AC99D0|nr:FtsW/RodA/SpoVE family cell cycle protein [Carboxydocella sp. JDF658]GAW31937.1 cell division protein FtsW [Carboxydocella sp. JDF658]